MVTISWRGSSLRMRRSAVGGLLRLSVFDLVVDAQRHGVHVGDRFIDMHGKAPAFRILLSLARRQGEAVELKQLFQESMGRRCRTYYDCRALYFQVWTLRDALASTPFTGSVVESGPLGYRLRPGLRVAWVPPSGPPRAAGGEDRVVEIVQQRGSIDNRTYRDMMRVTRSTAARDLARLVKLGLLSPMGGGRTARYVLAARAS